MGVKNQLNSCIMHQEAKDIWFPADAEAVSQYNYLIPDAIVKMPSNKAGISRIWYQVIHDSSFGKEKVP